MKLIFVYNAKSDVKNQIFDFAHKIISPSTYSCELCMLTHHNFGERDSWKKFVKETNNEMVFYHIDEFESLASTKYSYPVILKKSSKGLEIFIGKEEISGFKNTEELMDAMRTRLFAN